MIKDDKPISDAPTRTKRHRSTSRARGTRLRLVQNPRRPLPHGLTVQAWAPLPHERRAYWAVKRALDVAGAAALLVLLGIPMLIVALLIKLDDPKGPVFYRQTRSGLGGRRFSLLKFRTMVTNADELREQLREHSLAAWPLFKMEDDPRQTRIGRFLRRTDLDELPQLLNVVKGDMSLVGPRPTSFGTEAYDLWHTGRLEYRPGVTGPWQVYGKDTMTFDERCRLEINFFRQPSIWAEVRVLFATAGLPFAGRGVVK